MEINNNNDDEQEVQVPRGNVLHPALQTRERIIAHPSLCNGNAYSQDMRSLVLFIALNIDEEDPHVSIMLSLLRGGACFSFIHY